jgi:hypothetical protein
LLKCIDDDFLLSVGFRRYEARQKHVTWNMVLEAPVESVIGVSCDKSSNAYQNASFTFGSMNGLRGP